MPGHGRSKQNLRDDELARLTIDELKNEKRKAKVDKNKERLKKIDKEEKWRGIRNAQKRSSN